MIIDLGKEDVIPRTVSKDTIQEKVRPILKEILDTLNKEYSSKIAGIYLYGSFSRGDGIFGKSDLDFFIVTKEAVDFKKKEKELTEKYREYFIDVNLLSETENKVISDNYGWLAFISLFCVCIHGEDLTTKSQKYKVNAELISKFIEDFEFLMEKYQKENSPLTKLKMAKLTIRMLYYSKLATHLKWTTILTEQIEVVKSIFPEYNKEIDNLFSLINGLSVSEEEFNRSIHILSSLVSK